MLNKGLAPATHEAQTTGLTGNMHDACFACGNSTNGLGLRFDCDAHGNTSAEWACDSQYQSYAGIIHGGIIATLLDAAMTNCLISKGLKALTAKLEVQYIEPLKTGTQALISAKISRARPPLFLMEAEVRQDNALKAKAQAKFLSLASA